MVKKTTSPSLRPLFIQIKEMITERVKTGEWAEGIVLPSELDFARQYQVSQGTVRKAMAEMADEKLVVRFRGKGTFVATHTDEREHSHFFHIVGNDGVKILPGTHVLTCRRRKANREIECRLNLPKGSLVTVVERLRTLDNQAIIFETITVSDDMFPGLCALKDNLPNELYPLYESNFSTRVVRADECIRAVSANAREAEVLGVDEGTPLLEVDRIAISINQNPVEWRRSHCLTRDHCYQNAIS